MTESSSTYTIETYNRILKKRPGTLSKKNFKNCPSADEILKSLYSKNGQTETLEILDEIPSALRPDVRQYGIKSIVSNDTEPCSGACLNCPWYCGAGHKSNSIMKKCSSICKYCPWSNQNRDEVIYN